MESKEGYLTIFGSFSFFCSRDLARFRYAYTKNIKNCSGRTKRLLNIRETEYIGKCIILFLHGVVITNNNYRLVLWADVVSTEFTERK